MLPWLGEIFANQALIAESDIVCNSKAVDVKMAFVKAIAALTVRGKIDGRTALAAHISMLAITGAYNVLLYEYVYTYIDEMVVKI